MVPAKFSISVDPDGIIRIRQQGFWTLETAKRFTEEAEPKVRTAQAKGILRLVIDARQFDVPDADVSDHLAAFDMRIRREGDRITMIVGSSLLKVQMKRKITRSGLEVFISENAAQTWVSA